MKDFKIIEVQTVLKVTSVTVVRGLNPPSVLVVGNQLNLAQVVEYNGEKATEFFIPSPDRMLLRVPSSQVGKSLKELKVLSSAPLPNLRSGIRLSMFGPARLVSGMERLVQAWLLIFFTTPGSDIFSPESGGGARALIGRSSNGDGSGIAADLALAVERTTSELLRLQAKSPLLPPSERLLSCTLSSVRFDPEMITLYATVSLQNMLGESSVMTLNK